MTAGGRSVPFDRAVAYYDRTRGLSDEAMAGTFDVLEHELGGRGRVLEVGVGTGLLALRLWERGMSVVGIDLSAAMLAQLARKAGRSPLPIAVADATRMPFGDATFSGAYLRWVLQLIPAWESAIAEMHRVVEPQGPLLVLLGDYGGVREQIKDRFSEITGIAIRPVGLNWGDTDALDRAMEVHGRRYRELPPIREAGVDMIGDFIDDIREQRYSWTWPIPTDVIGAALPELQAWATRTWGDLDEPRPYAFDFSWRVYEPSSIT